MGLSPSHSFPGRSLFLILSAVISISLSSCTDNSKSSSNSPNSAPAENLPATPEKEQIALVMKTLTNPFFIEMERGARRAEKDLGIELHVKTAAQETSIQQQIGIVENLIRDQVDAIVIAPGDSIDLIPVLKQARDAGIVVINIDNQLDPEYSKKEGLTDVPYISVDNEQAAYDSVKTLTQKINMPTSVAILEGIRGARNAEDRKNGAIRAFSENPFVTIDVMQTAHWKIDEGFEVTKKIFDENPDIGAMFCANDMMALGAIKFLQSAEREDVLVASYDALDEAKEAIKAGTLLVTIDQQPAEQGYKGILYAHRALGGEQLPMVTLINTLVVTKDNIN